MPGRSQSSSVFARAQHEVKQHEQMVQEEMQRIREAKKETLPLQDQTLDEEKAKQEAEEKSRLEAEEKARKEAEAKIRLEA